MHNNFTLDKTPKLPKEYYSITEAAVLWARSEGAKGANDPRIAFFSGLILEAVNSGDLRVADGDNGVIFFDDLREWFAKTHPKSRPKFLFGN